MKTPHEFIGCKDNGYEPGGEEKVLQTPSIGREQFYKRDEDTVQVELPIAA